VQLGTNQLSVSSLELGSRHYSSLPTLVVNW
jgi:hypothetical protein